MIAGTAGYDDFVELFIESSQTLAFNEACKDFIDFLPDKASNILDLGSGAGQNAAAIARLGHNVTAVEPMSQFLKSAQDSYKDLKIKWLKGSLPELACLATDGPQFDFILINAVWHHLLRKAQEILNRDSSSSYLSNSVQFFYAAHRQ